MCSGDVQRIGGVKMANINWSTLMQIYKRLKPALEVKGKIDEVTAPVERALDITKYTLATGELRAYDDNLEQVRRAARILKLETGRLASRHINWWYEHHTTNAFDPVASRKDLNRLQEKRRALHAQKEALWAFLPFAVGCASAIDTPVYSFWAMFINGPTSLVELDKYAAKEIVRDIRVSINNLERIVERLRELERDLERSIPMLERHIRDWGASSPGLR